MLKMNKCPEEVDTYRRFGRSVACRALFLCWEGTSWSKAKTKVLENESVYLFTICHAH